MSVSVNPSEKFLSIDSSVAKASSSVRADSPVDSQERQTFRATFEEQRVVENRQKDQVLKRNRQESLENRRKTSEIKQEKLSGSASEHKNIRGSERIDRSEKMESTGAVEEVKSVDTKGVGAEKLAASGQNKDNSDQLNTRSDSHVEGNNELVEDGVVIVEEHSTGENPVSVATVLALGLEGATFVETAETAVIAEKSGNVLPLEGESGESPKTSAAINPTLQGGEQLQVSAKQTSLGSRETTDVAGLGVARGRVESTIPSQNNRDSLASQGKETNSSLPNTDTSMIAKSQTVETQARPTNTEASEVTKTVGNIVADFENKDMKPNTESLLSDKNATGPLSPRAGAQSFEPQSPEPQNAGLGSQQEVPASIMNSAVSAEMKSADERVITAQAQKNSDGNIHSQATATVDKNLNNESKAQYLNGKTETTHFVNSQHSSSTVNANVAVDGGTASARQSYTLDTGQVLDAQIKDVEKLSLSQASEQSDSTEVTEINKSPIHAARWTQSIEQIQSLGKSTSLQTAIPSKFGGDQWASAVADKVMWLSSQRIQSAEIRLDPPELGPMQVRVSVQNDQVNVSFVSHHQSVREALEQNVFKLREQFGNEGMDLVDVSVSDHPSQQSMSNGGDSGFHGEDSSPSSIDKELTQETEVLELLNLVDHYV